MNTSDGGERLISPSHPPTSSPRELPHSWFLFLYHIFHPSPIPSCCARHPTYFALEVGKVADVLGDRGSRCGACLCFVVLTILPSPFPFVIPYTNSRNPLSHPALSPCGIVTVVRTDRLEKGLSTCTVGLFFPSNHASYFTYMFFSAFPL